MVEKAAVRPQLESPGPAGDRAPWLVMREITKAFPGVVANDRVSLDVRPGEVHALLGENGAGKTTLVHILYGIHQPDAGEIRVNGRPVRIRSPRQAIELGIGLVPQHFLLVRRHTVAENVALGLSGVRFFWPLASVEQRLRELGERYGLGVDPRAFVWQLSAGEQQRVEILKALIRGARLLVLDEPTSVLTPQEARSLFEVLRRMTQEGHSVIFISHKLDEVLEIADRITVLRRGRVAASLARAGTDKRTLAELMVGREVAFDRRAGRRPPGPPVLELRDLWARDDRGFPAVRGISLTVHQGEILGLAGVAGNGQHELVEVLTGLRRPLRGEIRVRGRPVAGQSPRALAESGVAHIPEDRLGTGVVAGMTVAENLVLNRYRYPPFCRGPLLDTRRITEFARQAVAEYGIVTPGLSTRARALSGGNIQKLILARELSGQPALIVAAHPTYGLDVGATEQVHEALLRQRDRGAGVLLVSEDLDEILALSDRIAVVFGGRIMGVVEADEAERERIGLMMAGVEPERARG